MLTWLQGDYFITALAQWIACVFFVIVLPRRLSKWKTAFFCLGMLLIQTGVLWLMTKNHGIMPTGSLLVQVLKGCLYIMLMILHILTACRIPVRSAVVFGMSAFLTSEIAVGFSMFGHYLILINTGKLSALHRWGIAAGVFCVVFLLLFLIEKKLLEKNGIFFPAGQDIVIIAAVTILCYTISYMYLVFYGSHREDLWNRTLGNIPRWTYGLVGIFLLYALRVWKGYLKLRHELEMINSVFEKQKGQYEQARMNAEIIQQKYHDLKNQIAILKANISADRQEEWLQGLEQQVQQIEPKPLTGNPVLDTILWEKTQQCELHRIKLSYVMDGELFQDVAYDDLCVLFGGALDNAMEAVLKVSDPERRLIHVKALQQQGFLILCFENINDTPLTYKDGILTTTKEDKAGHGYGLKGIRYIAEKYGGSVDVKQENGWFRLTVLLQVRNLQEKGSDDPCEKE